MFDHALGTPSPSTSTPEHQAAGPQRVRAAVVTISDTRTLVTDQSGLYLANELATAGHTVVERLIVRDDAVEIRSALVRLIRVTDVVLTTGGTGIGGRDVTIPVVESLITKPIPGFGELFRMLSYEQVKGAAMLSRALGGLTRGSLLFAMPGSLNAVQTAWLGILKDELGHLVYEVFRQGQPDGRGTSPVMPPVPLQTAAIPASPISQTPLSSPTDSSTRLNAPATKFGRHSGRDHDR